MNYKIPSKWTKDDFTFATWLAFVENDAEYYDIMRDLQDCVMFGFTWQRSCGFRVDYAKYAEKVANREK